MSGPGWPGETHYFSSPHLKNSLCVHGLRLDLDLQDLKLKVGPWTWGLQSDSRQIRPIFHPLFISERCCHADVHLHEQSASWATAARRRRCWEFILTCCHIPSRHQCEMFWRIWRSPYWPWQQTVFPRPTVRMIVYVSILISYLACF